MTFLSTWEELLACQSSYIKYLHTWKYTRRRPHRSFLSITSRNCPKRSSGFSVVGWTKALLTYLDWMNSLLSSLKFQSCKYMTCVFICSIKKTHIYTSLLSIKILTFWIHLCSSDLIFVFCDKILTEFFTKHPWQSFNNVKTKLTNIVKRQIYEKYNIHCNLLHMLNLHYYLH